ncbi:MAG: hypothetical protein EBZ89_13255, partial [Chloroflexi bacterium]|nr:hypothetical protein [Chloroflexota bacterium]
QTEPRASVDATDLAPKTVGELAARSVGARNPSRQSAPRKVSQRLLAVSAALGAATFVLCGGNKFTALNVAVWCASVLTFVWASWERDRKVTPFQWAASGLELFSPERWQSNLQTGRPSDPRQTGRWRPQDGIRLTPMALIVVSLLVAGALVLTWRVGEVPREMTSDHAEKLLDVQDVLDGRYRIFFPRNTGREAMQFYLIALMTPLAGVSYLTMKLGTVLVGFFTLPFTFLFVRTVSGTGVAILALSLEVAMRWLLQVSRVGLRFPFPPAFGAAIAYFLFKCLRDRHRNDFLLLGLVIGIAQHTYTALRLVPLGVAVSLVIAYPWGSDTRFCERWSVCPRCFMESVLTRPSPRRSSVARGYLPVFCDATFDHERRLSRREPKHGEDGGGDTDSCPPDGDRSACRACKALAVGRCRSPEPRESCSSVSDDRIASQGTEIFVKYWIWPFTCRRVRDCGDWLNLEVQP